MGTQSSVKMPVNSGITCASVSLAHLGSGCAHSFRLTDPIPTPTPSLLGDNDFKISRSSRTLRKKENLHIGCAIIFLSLEFQSVKLPRCEAEEVWSRQLNFLPARWKSLESQRLTRSRVTCSTLSLQALCPSFPKNKLFCPQYGREHKGSLSPLLLGDPSVKGLFLSKCSEGHQAWEVSQRCWWRENVPGMASNPCTDRWKIIPDFAVKERRRQRGQCSETKTLHSSLFLLLLVLQDTHKSLSLCFSSTWCVTRGPTEICLWER